MGERVGVNVWGFEILKSLANIAKRLPRTAAGAPRNDVIVYLSKPPRADMPQETDNWHYRVIPPAKFWTRWRLPLDLYLHQPRPDVFLSLSHYAPKWCPCPRIVSIMDLSFLKFPQAFKPLVYRQLRDWTKESVKNAAHIITISEFNKKEIAREYGYPEDRITVIYPGVGENFKAEGRRPKAEGIKRKYLLFVGTRQPKKNLGRLIEAFGLVRKKFPKIELVVAGKTWRQFSGEKDEGQRTKAEGITYLGFVAQKDLPSLVAGAEGLVIPSLYEGFGIPAVEAMSLGTPVLASNVTSLPEIVGDAGILFDPLDVDQITKAIVKLLTMSAKQRQELAEKGKIQAKKFDWNKSAEDIMNVFSDIANARSLDFSRGAGFARDDKIK